VKERLQIRAGARVPIEDLVRRVDPTVELLAGASFQRGTELVHATHASAQVAWVRPFPTPALLRPDLHLSADYTSGPLDDVPGVSSGAVAIGASLGFDLGPLWVGPGADLRLPFRANQRGEAQYALAGAGLVSAGGGLPLGRALSLELRVDGYMGTQPSMAGVEAVYGLAARAGLRFHP
jgi:hypothetical protein